MRCLPLEQFITLLPNTEVISINGFNLLSFLTVALNQLVEAIQLHVFLTL